MEASATTESSSPPPPSGEMDDTKGGLHENATATGTSEEQKSTTNAGAIQCTVEESGRGEVDNADTDTQFKKPIFISKIHRTRPKVDEEKVKEEENEDQKKSPSSEFEAPVNLPSKSPAEKLVEKQLPLPYKVRV